MKTRYHYEVGAVRWRRHDGEDDVRAYRPNEGWEVEAMLIDRHPISGEELGKSQWWYREKFVGR